MWTGIGGRLRSESMVDLRRNTQSGEDVQILYAELLVREAEIVEAAESALELADAYQTHHILTPKFYDDG